MKPNKIEITHAVLKAESDHFEASFIWLRRWSFYLGFQGQLPKYNRLSQQKNIKLKPHRKLDTWQKNCARNEGMGTNQYILKIQCRRVAIDTFCIGAKLFSLFFIVVKLLQLLPLSFYNLFISTLHSRPQYKKNVCSKNNNNRISIALKIT